MRPLPRGTDMPVLLPPRAPGPALQPFDWRWGAALAGFVLLAAGAAQAQSGAAAEHPIAVILKWLPLISQGFALNVLISVIAMALGTALGLGLGLCQISLLLPVRFGSWALTQFFRNAPWLVLLFWCIFVLPFRVTIFGTTVEVPNWLRATIGLTLPVMANVSEIVRGAVQSLPRGQWEAAESLAFSRFQTLRMVILPQCLKRMLPPWMNLYAIVVMSTPLTSIVGVEEAMALTRGALNAERRGDLLIPMYGALLLAFFAYCWPIARATRWLETRARVRS